MRISFTNHSKETQSVYIVRRPNGSLTDVELFSKVKIAPEQTVTRAFNPPVPVFVLFEV